MRRRQKAKLTFPFTSRRYFLLLRSLLILKVCHREVYFTTTTKIIAVLTLTSLLDLHRQDDYSPWPGINLGSAK